ARLADDGIVLQHLDLGGGLGIRYREEQPPTAGEYVELLLSKLQRADPRFRSLAIHIEPGRSVVANAGILVTRVLYTKETPVKNFVIVDAAMNDLMRPTLYDAWQEILPVRQGKATTQLVDVVGPVCETGDFLARERTLAAQQGDLLAIMSAGAYGAVMSSNYNSRPRLPEIMVDGDRYHVVRTRESIRELYASEKTLP
ncbi:MAG TPA: diaminopimelate decarboxylase, partial [Acidiferrobacteraceae bacterium]|nr:diaminopimelate decarboxylase [Acidiferrobacteraceae bacterium]HEX20373.1 diaminopimelate decarboxylase [Acidiferrobacteraceae bacterium]